MFMQGTPARSGPRYRVRVRARVNGDVAQMVSALAKHSQTRRPGFESRHPQDSFWPRLDRLTIDSYCII